MLRKVSTGTDGFYCGSCRGWICKTDHVCFIFFGEVLSKYVNLYHWKKGWPSSVQRMFPGHVASTSCWRPSVSCVHPKRCRCWSPTCRPCLSNKSSSLVRLASCAIVSAPSLAFVEPSCCSNPQSDPPAHREESRPSPPTESPRARRQQRAKVKKDTGVQRDWSHAHMVASLRFFLPLLSCTPHPQITFFLWCAGLCRPQ